VGYVACLSKTVEFIDDRQIPIVMGNYDEGVGFMMHDGGFVYKHRAQDQLGLLLLKWTQAIATEENKRYLQTLPMQIRIEEKKPKLVLVHGSPRRINEYLYEDRPEATFDRIARVAGTDVLLFGHTHLPYQKCVSGVFFVNCGSVGKPKDGNPQPGYVILNLGRNISVEYRRVVYDLEAAAMAIRASDLPNEFAEARETGGFARSEINLA
jgi:putative phosphoesterase